MFTFDTDLTLESIMVGKEKTRHMNILQDLKTANMITENNIKFVPIPPVITDTDYVILLRTLFGRDHNIRTMMYSDCIDGYHCECCGLDLNIFNSTGYSICRECNNRTMVIEEKNYL